MGLWRSRNLNFKYTITNHNINLNHNYLNYLGLILIVNICKREHKLSSIYTLYHSSINHKLTTINLINYLKESLNNLLSHLITCLLYHVSRMSNHLN